MAAVGKAVVREYMLSRVEVHMRRGEVSTSALAGDATAHLGLWTSEQDVPDWVYELADNVAAQAEDAYWAGLVFAEKPIRYEPDGDVLFA